jgi:hypothetical protein
LDRKNFEKLDKRTHEYPEKWSFVLGKLPYSPGVEHYDDY